MSEFLNGYLECAFWSSLDYYDPEEQPRPLDENYGVDESQGGHSFWLSRNGHGAGFFDWSHPALLGEACSRLQDAARVYGTVDLYVGDDGKVYS